MFCYNCGGELGNTAQFCRSCGTKINRQNYINILNQMLESGKEMNDDTANKRKTITETLDIIAKIITGGLSFISGIVLFGAILGYFNNSLIPFVIFFLVLGIFEWVCDKLPMVPKIVFAVLEIIALIICFSIVGNFTTVASVKLGSPYAYPNITYEMAFNDYFSNPTWKTAGKDEDGNNVVKFTGNCYYMDEMAFVEVRFTVFDEQERFSVSSVRINGVDTGWLGNAIVLEIFEEYKQSHNIRSK